LDANHEGLAFLAWCQYDSPHCATIKSQEFILTEHQQLSLCKSKKTKLFYGYIIAAVAFVIQGLNWGIYSTFGVFFNSFLTDFGWLRVTIAGAASLSFFLNGVFNIIIGGLNDRFGPRRMMTFCGLFLGVGLLLMSQVNAVWQLYLYYGVLVAIGLCGADIILLSTVARWFIKGRGLASSIIKVGSGIGIMMMSVLASRLIVNYNWRIAYSILGSVCLILVVLLSQFLRRDPAEMDLSPYGSTGNNVGATNVVEEGLTIREAISTRQFWTMCLVYFSIVFNSHTIMTHTAQHAIDLGVAATSAASILSIIGGASIVGRLAGGVMSDRLGNRATMLICFVILAASLCWLQIATELWMLYVFAVLYSFSHGGFFAIISPMVAGIFGTRAHGLILGIIISFGTAGGALSVVLAGHLYDIAGSYRIAFWILLLFAAIGLAATVSLKPIQRDSIPE